VGHTSLGLLLTVKGFSCHAGFSSKHVEVWFLLLPQSFEVFLYIRNKEILFWPDYCVFYKEWGHIHQWTQTHLE
jgi:hypothetical protein